MSPAEVHLLLRWRPLWRTLNTCVAFCGVAAAALAPAPARAGAPATAAAPALADAAFGRSAAASSNAAAAGRSTRAARARKAARRASARRAAARRGSATLRGSRAAVDHAWRQAKRDGLAFAHSRREIERGARAGDYVRLSQSTRAYRLRGVSVPFVRPTTRAFVARFGADYRRSCGEPLTVTSAMRPTSMHLANSVDKTVHPTGMAVDLRIPQRSGCRAWMRSALIGLERQGVVNATEERRPAHFHVVVYRAP
jgi:hypothetical protein